MKGHVLNVLRFIMQLSTLVLSILFREQFSAGVVLRSIGGLLIVLGTALWVLSRIALGQFFTSSLSPKGLVTTGIYSKLRHPMYAGGLCLYSGLGILLQSIIGLAMTGLLVLPLLAYSAVEEERQMVKEFGEQYLAYRAKTAF